MTDRENDLVKQIDAIALLLTSLDTNATLTTDTINYIGLIINDLTAQLIAD